MYETLLSLPPKDPSFASVDLTEPGKRQWETNKSGYINWAVGRLHAKGEAGERAVDKVERSALEIGSGENLRNAVHAVGVAKDVLDRRQRDDDDDDSRMED